MREKKDEAIQKNSAVSRETSFENRGLLKKRDKKKNQSMLLIKFQIIFIDSVSFNPLIL